MTCRQELLLVLSPKVWRRCLERAGLYRSLTSREEIERFQVKAFNAIWLDAFSDVPFYRRWKAHHQLPGRIASLDELESWPIVSKREFQEGGNALTRISGYPSGHMMTGGSTGEPLRFGTWADDGGMMSSSQWIGRAAYGYVPGMRTFLLWGHHHLYGKGVKRWLKTALRSLKDLFSNMKRFSAYDLSAYVMRQACDRLIRFKPEVMIGFSAAVLAFCRSNADRQAQCRTLGVRFVVCTAGPLSDADKALIENFFAAPVCMEYGSVECGAMAYTTPETGHYSAFWDTHLLQTKRDESGEYRNIVTRLTRCYVPIIRYDIADHLEVFPEEEVRPLRFISVKGRPSDIVKLADGSSFFGALIGDCVKQVSRILANQTLVQGNRIEIHVLANGELTEAERALIGERCRLTVAALRDKEIAVVQKRELQTGRGGKIPLVLYG